VAHVAYTPVHKLDTIITDDEISPETLHHLRQQNVRVICVESQPAYTMKIVECEEE